MNDGQWRVLFLLLVLLGMEILRSPAVSGFIKGLIVTPLKQGAQ